MRELGFRGSFDEFLAFLRSDPQFFFTKPEVPEGWHSAMQKLTGTVLFVHP